MKLTQECIRKSARGFWSCKFRVECGRKVSYITHMYETETNRMKQKDEKRRLEISLFYNYWPVWFLATTTHHVINSRLCTCVVVVTCPNAEILFNFPFFSSFKWHVYVIIYNWLLLLLLLLFCVNSEIY